MKRGVFNERAKESPGFEPWGGIGARLHTFRYLEIRNEVGESGEDGLAKAGKRLSRGADPSTSSNSSKEKTP